MQYIKDPLTIEDQIEKLKSRGLKFEDEKKAAHYLSNISYYRLRAYTYPFQDNTSEDHPFIKEVSFEQIIQLYVFDRHLRLLLFNAIEKIEVALRAQIICNYSLKHGSHWHLKPGLYNNVFYFTEHMVSLHKELDRSNEVFLKHYNTKYTEPQDPPCWMSLEVCSMGLICKMFSNLKKDEIKDTITHYFGLKDSDLLCNWMFCISNLRNICAHHGRVWNRRVPSIQIPLKTTAIFIDNKEIYRNKLYAIMCCILYMLNSISPNHGFKADLLDLMERCPLLQEKEMGFPPNWKEEKMWQ